MSGQLGYWGGIAPSGKIAQRYKTVCAPVRRGAIIRRADMAIVSGDEAGELYQEFYGFLSEAGISSVKTDVQFALMDELTKASHRRHITPYLSAWSSAHLRHFAGRAIACMSQTPYVLFSQLLTTMGPDFPMRNSDDYFPHANDSHPWHIFCNAHNAVLTKYLNVVPGWDMFQTQHHWASFHAAARAISGGPVCITDEPGIHDVDIVHRLTATTPRGETMLLRPSAVGRSLDVYTGFEETVPCRVGAYHGPAGTGASFIGLFNCKTWEQSVVLHLNAFMGIESATAYIIRSFRSGKIGGSMRGDEGDAAIAVDVEGFGWEVCHT